MDGVTLLAMLLGMIFVTQRVDKLLNPFGTVGEVFAMTTGADTSSEKFPLVELQFLVACSSRG